MYTHIPICIFANNNLLINTFRQETQYMSDLLLDNLADAERWEWNVFNQRMYRNQGSPFLSSLGAYLDIGDDVVLKFQVSLRMRASSQVVKSRVGKILSVAREHDLVSRNIAFSRRQQEQQTTNRGTVWLLLNWWVEGMSNTYVPPEPHSHVALPIEIVRSNLVLWVPASLISDIAFIFHYEDIIKGVYGNTNGLRNTYFCRSMWDSNMPMSVTYSHPYYSIFSTDRVESYAERTWGMIEKIQNVLFKLMASRSGTQKLNQSIGIKCSHRDWEIIKKRFDKSNCCFYERSGVRNIHRYTRHLTQQTIKNPKGKKENIIIENKDMFDQLIRGFGSCVVSTVRRKFPSTNSRQRSEATQNLQSTDDLNSILPVHLCTIPNSEKEYKYRSTDRGITFRFDVQAQKLQILVRYAKLNSTDPEVYNFYGVALETRVVEPVVNDDANGMEESDQNRLIGQEFEAYDSNFSVVSLAANTVICHVTECDSIDSVYILDSRHSFEIDFVKQKIREYLS